MNKILAPVVSLLFSVAMTKTHCQKPQKPSKLTTPVVASTWKFGKIATRVAAPMLIAGRSAIDSVEEGIKAVEENNDDQYWVCSYHF